MWMFVRNTIKAKAPEDPFSVLDELRLGAVPLDEQTFMDTAISVDDYEELKKLEQTGKARLFELGPGLDADALWFNPALPSEAAAEETQQDRPWLANERFRLAISAAVGSPSVLQPVFFWARATRSRFLSRGERGLFQSGSSAGVDYPSRARDARELGLRDLSGADARRCSRGRDVPRCDPNTCREPAGLRQFLMKTLAAS